MRVTVKSSVRRSGSMLLGLGMVLALLFLAAADGQAAGGGISEIRIKYVAYNPGSFRFQIYHAGNAAASFPR